MPEVAIVIPAHPSTSGKAILVFRSVYQADQPQSRTRNTIIDPAVLTGQCEHIHSSRTGTEIEAAVLTECAAVAPVFDAVGEPARAIGLVVPAARWPLKPWPSMRCVTPNGRCHAN